jgi:hypothetical protein
MGDVGNRNPASRVGSYNPEDADIKAVFGVQTIAVVEGDRRSRLVNMRRNFGQGRRAWKPGARQSYLF